MKKHVFKCVDGHTCGNPVRLIVEGAPALKGSNMSEKRMHFIKDYDWIRKGLMFEPRGHDMMSGAFLYPPANSNNDFGILFIETSGCLPMCGHGSIGVVTMAIEEGIVVPKVPGKIKMETPAGLVEITYHQHEGKVEWVKLVNVGSYLAALDLKVNSNFLGQLTFDVAYGGNYYAIVDPQDNFTGLQDYSASQLIEMARELRQNINLAYPDLFVHPDHSSIRDVSHILWTGKTISKNAVARNAVFYGDKAIDRSPCGTGTSARMAQWHAKGKLALGEEFVHESFIGSKFIGVVESECKIGNFNGIVPSIKGWARQYGYNEITIDEADPYAQGFQVI
ncbi:4-hydroxyproline epimerase [Maribacter sp. PR1]|uniref:4-hydroxyproline epimerase n=1 Tax=Maribacter cobaltidurans TaxID=1178778 RepID=A0ABU7IUJ4_9FLAO|nr:MULTISPECIES: 4-hydroxyproline epimerase [Maribacter]MDC6389126.1 4-hydroxyproline epimerase [Maribacter sp. PR1]MEE1976513.1 4-hydroxyproline epimerase [Maribacter cobaltidurans]